MQFQGLYDDGFHRLDISHDLIIPKSQNLVALALQPFGASCIASLLTRMLATVHLNDEAFAEASKVDDIPPIGCCLRNLCPFIGR